MNLETTHTVTSGQTGVLLIDFTFSWIEERDIKVYKDAVETPFTNWRFTTRNQIAIDPEYYTTGTIFKVRRETPTDSAVVQFNPGGSIRAQDLNNNQKQVFNVIEEFQERTLDLTATNSANPNIQASGNEPADLYNFIAAFVEQGNSFEYKFQSSADEPQFRPGPQEGINLIDGDIWFDTNNERLNYRHNNAWRPVTLSDTELESLEIIAGAASSFSDYGSITQQPTGLSSTVDWQSISNSISQITDIGNDLSGANTIGTLATTANLTNVATVATGIADVNRYANEYVIASSLPSSGNFGGKLWFDTTASYLKFYDQANSTWQNVGGATGPAGTITIGNVTSVGPSATPTVVNTSSSAANVVLDFGLQQGQQGIQGVRGITHLIPVEYVANAALSHAQWRPTQTSSANDTFTVELTSGSALYQEILDTLNIWSNTNSTTERAHVVVVDENNAHKASFKIAGPLTNTSGTVTIPITNYTVAAGGLTDGTTYYFAAHLAGEKGDTGAGWTSGTYNTSTGVATFNSPDPTLAFNTADLRGVDGSTIFFQSSTPSGGKEGDLWVESTSNGKNLYRRGASAWPSTPEFQMGMDLTPSELNDVSTVSTDLNSQNSEIATVISNLSDMDKFNNRYQVASSAPTTRHDGTSLVAGDLYFNNSSNRVFVRDHNGNWDGVTLTGSDLANVQTVVTDITGNNTIGNVSSNMANVVSVDNISTEINTVANSISDIQTLASNVNSTDISTVANNINDIHAFASTYFIAANNNNAPNGVSSSTITHGDLWYDTTNDVLSIYDNSTWVAATLSTSQLADVSAVANDLFGTNDLGNVVDTVVGSPTAGSLQTCANSITDINTIADVEDGTVVNLGLSNIAGQISPTNNIQTVASQISPTNNIATVANIASDVSTVAADSTALNTVSTNISDVSTVSNANTQIAAVAGQISPTNNIQTVAGNTTNINTVAGLNTEVTNLGAIATEITNVNNIRTDVSAIGGNSTLQTNIGTVAGISSDVTTVAPAASDITTIAGNSTLQNNIATVAGKATEVTNVSSVHSEVGVIGDTTATGTTLRTNIGTVAGISSNVTTVAGMNSNITTVINDASDIGTVAAISSDVTTVAGISTDVTAVKNDAADIQTVAANGANITTVAGLNTEVTNVSNISTAVQTIGGSGSMSGTLRTNIATVAGDTTHINSLGTVSTAIANLDAIKTNISSVDGVKTEISNLGPISTEITNVDNVRSELAVVGDTTATGTTLRSNITTVAGDSSDIQALSPISTEIQSIGGNATLQTNIGSVGGSITDVTAVAGQITPTNNISTVAGVVSDISTVAGISTDVTAVAGGLAGINSFADTYFVAADNNGSPNGIASSKITQGDLWYDTTNNSLKVYDSVASTWTPASLSSSQLTDVTAVAADISQTNDHGNVADALVNTSSGGALTTCASNITDIQSVATNLSNNNIATVAGLSTELTNLGGITTEITTCSSNITNISNVAANITSGDLATVAGVSGDVQTCAFDITDIQTVAGQISPTNNISTVATALGNNTVVMTTGSQTLVNKTLDDYVETIDTAGGSTLSANDGHIHYVSYNSIATVTIDLDNGQSMLVMVSAASNAITWSATTTFHWVGGSAPSPLNSTGYTAIEFWKVNNITYGALVGDVS